MFDNLSSEYFNLIEGVFWLILGLFCAGAFLKVKDMYKRLTIFSTFILVTFGISDFLQVAYGSFLVTGMEWLLIWKVADVIGLLVIFTWYLILRFKY